MSDLIKITKNGETIEISPLALEDHKGLGWVEAPVEAPGEPAVPPKTKAKPE